MHRFPIYRIVPAAWIFVLTFFAQAQIQIAGRVVRSDTGAPIEGATIERWSAMVPKGNGDSVTTNANGEYQFDFLTEGVFTIYASADGFVPQTYRRGASPDGAFLSVKAGSNLRGVDFQLTREAVIKGVIINMKGEPVEAGVTVTAVRREKREDGSERLLPISQTITTANGTFTLKELSAGTYFVCVNGPGGYTALGSKEASYRETWYGNASSVEQSIPVSLREGEERSGLQIEVAPERRYRVIVWPSGPKGEPVLDLYQVSIMHRSHTTTKREGGPYVIPDVPAGHYTLVTTAWSDSRYVGGSSEDFEIRDADVTLRIAVDGLTEISGIVKPDHAIGSIPSGTKIKIVSLEGAAQASDVDMEGRFRFERVLAGHYAFSLLQPESGIVLERVRCGGVDVKPPLRLVVVHQQKVDDCELTLTQHGR